MKNLILVICLFFSVSLLYSQEEITITGTIMDGQSKIPLPSVNVVEKGTSHGVLADFDGNFSINVSSDAILVFSFLGYTTKEIEVKGQAEINVSLKPETSDLGEVVVVGYGKQKKANLTGSVSSIKGDLVSSQAVGQTKNALQGIAPGVTVTQNSGQPGGDGGTIRIRGLGTLGNNEPLVIVDGRESSLDNVAPHDIENISVLKDAASSAIYGSRAANGVILVTTKRGKEGLTINYDTWLGVQTPTDMPDMVDAIDHMTLLNEAYRNVGRDPLWTEDYIDNYRENMPSDEYPNTDWQKLTVKNTALQQNHNLSLSAGGEKAKIYSSFSLMDQNGIVPNTDYQRYNFRVNADYNITKKLTASFDLALRKTNSKTPSSGVNYIFHYMRYIPANENGLLSNGLYGEGWNGQNPLARAVDGGIMHRENLGVGMNFKMKYLFTDWLNATVVYSPTIDEPHVKTFSKVTQTYDSDGETPTYFVPTRSALSETMNRNKYNNLRIVLNANKSFADKHTVDFTGGYEQEDQIDHFISAYREDFPFPDYDEIDAGPRTNERTGGSSEHWALRSLFGRLQYNFDKRYLLEANLRIDESSRFAEGNREGVFPSFSAAWRISEENFIDDKGVITQLKLRGSWGQLGNQNIGLYPYLTQVNLGMDYIFDGQRFPGAALTDMANPDVTWETSETTDIGVDLTLWNNFDFTFDWYRKHTKNILLPLEIPRTLGLEPPYVNAGVVENIGWELSVAYENQIGDFKYNLRLNVSDVKNEILDLNGIEGSGLQVNHEGYAMGSFYGYEAIGFFQSQEEVENHATQFGNVASGDVKYRDLNDDGVINADDQKVVGNPIPRYTYGFNLDFKYRNWDMSIFFQGVGKAQGYIYGQGIMPFYVGGTVQEQHKDYWTEDNPDATYPRLAFNSSNNEQNSSFWMRDASYFRLKTLQLGYALPQDWIGGLKNVRIYYSGRNLFTIDNFYKGYDPEAPVSNGGWYPQMRVHTAGLTVNF